MNSPLPEEVKKKFQNYFFPKRDLHFNLIFLLLSFFFLNDYFDFHCFIQGSDWHKKLFFSELWKEPSPTEKKFESKVVDPIGQPLHPSPAFLWGFFAHRLINRMAVFTLPPDLIVFYKRHIDWISEHAVDPDRRRYSSPFEGVRHYIDLDRYGAYPFPNLPRNWTDALLKFTPIFAVNQHQDTLLLLKENLKKESSPADSLELNGAVFEASQKAISRKKYRLFFIHNILSQYYSEEWLINCDSLAKLVGLPASQLNCRRAFAVDSFSGNGILPYHLLKMQHRLTEAFMERDSFKILRLSAELGHYLADANVPLHTTENYDGQMSGQSGIHALWESRLPELFADKEFDFWVGKAKFIERPKDYFWNIVLKSNSQVDSVLLIEKKLSKKFPDKKYCIEERSGVLTKTACRNYASAYNQRLNGMVEAQMRAAIRAVGSAWYTAWWNAGQPDLKTLTGEEITRDSTFLKGNNLPNLEGNKKIRKHPNR